MTASGQTKRNMQLDLTLMKQQLVQVGEGLQNMQAMLNGMGQEMNQVSNAQSIWIEALRLLLVEKGVIEEPELKAKASEVSEGLKQQAIAQAEAGMTPGANGPPPVEEDLDGDSIEDLEDDDKETEDYPV